ARVGSLEESVCREVESIGLMRRKDNSLRPLKAILLVHCSGTNGIQGQGSYVLLLPGMVIIAGNFPAIGAGIDDFRIARIRRHVTTLATAHRIPIGPVDASAIAGAGNAHGGVVLLR